MLSHLTNEELCRHLRHEGGDFNLEIAARIELLMDNLEQSDNEEVKHWKSEAEYWMKRSSELEGELGE